MTVQELSKALSPMGYTVEDTDDVVRITIDPSDFIRGAPKLQKELLPELMSGKIKIN